MRILRASDRTLLIEADDLAGAMRLHALFAGVPGVVERIAGARTVLVHYDPVRTGAAELAERLEAAGAAAGHARMPDAGEVVIPVHYDGEDLEEVAGLLEVSVAELVSRHLAADWKVAFSGFAPGFGYIVGDDPLFDVPRRASPRTRVPAGSVALAGRFTGVYPRETPGGWQLIGRTDAVMWDLDRDPPALLQPGTRVRFVRAAVASLPVVERAERVETHRGVPVVERAERVETHRGVPVVERGPFDRLRNRAGDRVETPAGFAPVVERAERVETPRGDPLVERAQRVETPLHPSTAVEVLNASLPLLVQDAGRPGHADLGVSASGAADRTAMRDANRAVGNPPSAAVLECVGSVVLHFHGSGVGAVAGAAGELVLTDRHGSERDIAHGAPFAFFDGDELELGPPAHGVRCVIGLRGGIVVPPVLGSRSTDTLAGLGPAPLTTGDIVPVGPQAGLAAVDPSPVPRRLPASGELVELVITLGPRDDWFTASARAVLLTQEWLVTPRSDRVGIRLHGDVPLERAIHGELPSEGAVTGAIQVPPDGQPVLFLPDHPLTGGYPIIGALTDDSLDLAGQLPPGARIRFRVRHTAG